MALAAPDRKQDDERIDGAPARPAAELAVIAAAVTAGLIEWSVGLVERAGLGGMVVLLFLEAVVPPVPSEAALLLAGFLVGSGRYGVVPVLAATTAGSVLGALVLYGAGRLMGEARIVSFLALAGRPLRVTPADLHRAGRWFERHGAAVVFFGRMVPVIRSLVSVPAGAERMALPTFVAYTAAGSGLWNSILLAAGWALGQRWAEAQRWADLAVVAVLVVAAIAAATLRWRRRRPLGVGGPTRPLTRPR